MNAQPVVVHLATTTTSQGLRRGPRAALLLGLGALLAACAGDEEKVQAGDTAADAAGGGDGGGYDGSDGSDGSDGYSDGSDGSDGSSDGGSDDGDWGWPSDTGASADSGAPADTGAPVECDSETPVTLYLSPDDSNSVASPALVQAAIEADRLWSAPVRPWEYMNAYSYPYPAAAAGGLDLHIALAPDPSGEADTYALQIGVQAGALAERPPLHLVFAVDTSGSMSGVGIDTAREIGPVIAGQLQSGDKVSVLAWSDSRSVLLAGHAVSGPHDDDVLEAFDGLGSAGSTDLSAGLRTAYDLATAHAAPGWVSRVVLVSDGGANVGETDAALIGAAAGAEDEDGIYMAGIGVGWVGAYSHELMDVVTDLGGGASMYMADSDDIERQLGGTLLRTFGIAARDVQVQLDLPPGFEIVRYSGEEFSADPTEIEPQHLSPDDGMVFLQSVRTCAPELLGPDSLITVHLRWLDAQTFAPQSMSLPVRFSDALAADRTPMLKAQAVYATAEALRAAVEGGPAARRLADAEAAVLNAMAASPTDLELDELAGLIEAIGGADLTTP
jgi:Ca-activated chloride channel family protein